MVNIIILILLLALMSGFVAFIGDKLGTIIGKKRLSIFGARPRRTGQIIGVLAGIAIMLITIAVLALVNSGAVRTILRGQEVAAELSRLLAEQDSLNDRLSSLNLEVKRQEADLTKAENERASVQGLLDIARDALAPIKAERDKLNEEIDAITTQLNNLETQANVLNLANTELKSQNSKLESENSDLLSQKQILENLNASLTTQISSTNKQMEEINAQVEKLNAQLEAQAEELNRVQAILSSTNNDGITFRENEIVFSGLISAQDRNEIRSELSNLVNAANNRAIERGGGQVVLSSTQFDALVNDTINTPIEDIVTLRSSEDYFGVSEIKVDIESFENIRIFQEGGLLLSKQIFLDKNNSTQSSVRVEIATLISEAKTKLVLKGLSSTQVTEIFDSEGFVNQLLRMNGAITIGLIATEDIYASGPAKMELAIIY